MSHHAHAHVRHSVRKCDYDCGCNCGFVVAGVSSSSDVKELTPEWYYLPDFLRNTNGLDLGTRQGGEVVNDVKLPPWAWYVHTRTHLRIRSPAVYVFYREW